MEEFLEILQMQRHLERVVASGSEFPLLWIWACSSGGMDAPK